MKTVFYLQGSHCQSNVMELAGATRAAKAFDWNLRIIEYGDSMMNRWHLGAGKSLRERLRELADFWKPLGVIVDCGAAPTHFSKGEFAPLPTVFLDRHPSSIERGAACVYSDSDDIGKTAARELMALGNRTFAFAPWPDPLPWSVGRGAAFAQALRMNGFDCRAFRTRTSKPDDATFLSELEGWIKTLPLPAAVFAANDSIAEHVVGAALACKIKIPDELAVLGVDNDPEMQVRSPISISTIQLDSERAGYDAAQLLHEMIIHPRRRPASATFGSLAVVRHQSTHLTRRHDDLVDEAIRLIRQRAISGLRPADVFKALKCPRRLLELRFREITGKSILEDILEIRIEQAKLLISQSADDWETIAKSCGFNSVQAFRKQFIAKTGVSPAVWRRKRKQ